MSAPAHPRLPLGISCPQCRVTRVDVLATRYPAPGQVTRYRQCSGCGCRFKTRETMVAITRRPRP